MWDVIAYCHGLILVLVPEGTDVPAQAFGEPALAVMCGDGMTLRAAIKTTEDSKRPRPFPPRTA